MVTYDPEALKERARNLGPLNGLRMTLVELVPATDPTTAELEVRLWNTNRVTDIRNAAMADILNARTIFLIHGGRRLPAGPDPGQVRVIGVTAGAEPTTIRLTVAPIGDYSTYTLGLTFADVDPVFSTLPFRFRPGCFTTDCEPGWCAPDEPGPTPSIDYLARDYDSFKHTLIAAMMERVPGWRPTSEADLDETLIELLSVRADELADLQDRVLAEAYLGTARKRVSIARHARLMDYHVHQGNQASTWLTLDVGPAPFGKVPAGLTAWTTAPENPDGGRQVFETLDPVWVGTQQNEIRLHTWSRTLRSLAAGTTEADLLLDAHAKNNAENLRDRINDGRLGHLVIEEIRDPETCRLVGFDRNRRQLLTLIAGSARAVRDPMQDPQHPGAETWAVRVSWREPLLLDYCFVSSCGGGGAGDIVDDVSVFRGNVVRAFHGPPLTMRFLQPGTEINPVDPKADRTRYIDLAPADACAALDDACRPGAGGRLVGASCRLPEEDGPLAYRNSPPGGEVPSCSTLTLIVIAPSGERQTWEECPSFVYSRADDPHFIVETDELGRSVIRFGNGRNGRGLPDGATVECTYQVGQPLEGNVGSDSITNLDTSLVTNPAGLLKNATVRNPLDVVDGRAPEPVAEIIRRVPEAYRARQLRAVTLADYVRRAAEVEGVARAAARYAWTGSWRTVQVTIDPVGGTVLDADLRARVLRHLSAVRLIGEDIELRAPQFVPLDIEVVVCIDPGFWLNDVRPELRQAFSDGLDRSGRKAFFHPDRWTFGQELHASEIAGRLEGIAGVDHVTTIRMRRFDAATPGTDAIVAVRPNEILLVRNDPDRRDAGTISFELEGGRA